MIKFKRSVKVENDNCRKLLKELADFVYDFTYGNDFAFMPHENTEYYVRDLLPRIYEELGEKP